MGSNNLNVKATGNVIDETWYNDFRTALGLDVVPRNSSGVPTDIAGSLGSSSLGWLYAYLNALKFRSNGKLLTLSPPAGLVADYGLTLPGALPAANRLLAASAAGVLSFGLADSVQTTDIKDANVTGPKLATSCADASTLEVASGSMRIKALGVGTSHIVDGAITQAKRAALTELLTSSCGTYTTTSGAIATITNLSGSFTCTGRPVFVGLIPAAGGTGRIRGYASSFYCDGTIYLYRDATAIGYFNFRNEAQGASYVQLIDSASKVFTRDAPGAGSFTYSAKALCGGGTFEVTDCKLWVYEL